METEQRENDDTSEVSLPPGRRAGGAAPSLPLPCPPLLLLEEVALVTLQLTEFLGEEGQVPC